DLPAPSPGAGGGSDPAPSPRAVGELAADLPAPSPGAGGGSDPAPSPRAVGELAADLPAPSSGAGGGSDPAPSPAAAGQSGADLAAAGRGAAGESGADLAAPEHGAGGGSGTAEEREPDLPEHGSGTAEEPDPDVALVLRAYAAFARGDIDGAVRDLAPDVDWVEPDEFPGGGHHRGPAAVAAYLRSSYDSWGELHSEPVAHRRGDQIVIVHRVWGTLRDGTAASATVADVFTVEDGKVVLMMAYADPADAFR
ncbi:nuclear transport factor 2 family protein, partial [Dactylosporangium sp. NPDC000521]|uniref:nuclear transport factor 2 family protein n=1 Tax=Dactylosporangium sp. NPDC000521 TaxID=3363975 RepID=UPI0036CB3872